MRINIDRICDILSEKCHWSNRVIDSLYYHIEDEHPTSQNELVDCICSFVASGVLTHHDDIDDSELAKLASDALLALDIGTPSSDILECIKNNRTYGILSSKEWRSMKKIIKKPTNNYVKCSTNNWPTREEWLSTDLYEDEAMWMYLEEPEDRVNSEFQIFPEPSVQGSSGGMFIFDESGDDNENIYVDINDWWNAEINMAASSSCEEDYERKYRDYIEQLLQDNGWL